MTRVCHLFDETASWEHRVGVWQLLDRLDRGAFDQHVFSLDPRALSALDGLEVSVESIPRVVPVNFALGPVAARRFERVGVDLVHAWGARAGAIASAATDAPVVVELFDPADAPRDARILRSLGRSIGLGVICNSERMRRRLTECGVPLEMSAVVRPGVDFSQIAKVQRGELREEMGIARDEFAVMIAPPVSRAHRCMDAVNAVAMVNHMRGGVRLVVPEESAASRRIERFCEGLGEERSFCCVAEGRPVEEVIAAADAMVVSSPDERSTTAIAWAMAGSTPVVAPATYSVAELIGSGLNGLLFKPEEGRSSSVAIARLLLDREKQSKVKEVARGHAYEVFGIRRRIDQIMRVYENVMKGVAPGEGIVDSAAAG